MALFALKTNSALGAFTTGINALSTFSKTGSLSSAIGSVVKNTITSRVGSTIESKINSTLYRITGDTSLNLDAITSGLSTLGILNSGGVGDFSSVMAQIPTHDGYLQNILNLQQVEWNTDQLWDIKLGDANGLPSYFQGWLPVIDVDEDAAHLNTRDFQMGTTTIVIAEGTHSIGIQVVFVDDHYNSLLNYFTTWMNQISGGSDGRITPTGDAYKMLYIKKMTRQKNVVEIRPYKVVPSGTLTFSGKSMGDLSQYMLKFEVIGSPGVDRTDLDPSSLLSGAVNSVTGLVSSNSTISKIATGLNQLQSDASSAIKSVTSSISSSIDSLVKG